MGIHFEATLCMIRQVVTAGWFLHFLVPLYLPYYFRAIKKYSLAVERTMIAINHGNMLLCTCPCKL